MDVPLNTHALRYVTTKVRKIVRIKIELNLKKKKNIGNDI